MFQPHEDTPPLQLTHQLDDLDEDPVVGGGGHEFEEERGQRQVVLGFLLASSQMTLTAADWTPKQSKIYCII